MNEDMVLKSQADDTENGNSEAQSTELGREEEAVTTSAVAETNDTAEQEEVSEDGDQTQAAESVEESETVEPEAETEATVDAAEETASDEDEEDDDNSQESGDVSFTDFIDNIPEMRRGIIVKGVIVRYDNDTVYVDVRDKSEGKVPLREFTSDPDFDLDQAIEDREEIDVYVRNIRTTDAGKEILLSKSKVDFGKNKEVVEQAYNEKTPLEVKVINVVKDGVIATYGGVDIYIHRTQLEMSTVKDLEAYRGQTIEILVTQFDPDRRRLRVSGSRRSLLNARRKERAKEVWETIEVGDIYEGVVRNLTDFGAFVDIGGVDGLVHISELSWKRIKHPSEVINVDDVIQVYVKDFDKERKRISLGYRRIEDDPYAEIEERFPVGSIITGKVVRMFNFGAFVEIDEGVDALCHISQISNLRLNHPEEVLEVGQTVEARVIDVSNHDRKISISIRDVNPIDTRPDGTVPESLEDSGSRQAGGGNTGGRRRKGGKGRDGGPTTYRDSSDSDSSVDTTMLDAARAAGLLGSDDDEDDDYADEEETVEVQDSGAETAEETETVEAVEEVEADETDTEEEKTEE